MKKDQILVSAVRPVFLNLTQIQLPVGALASILHRLSGIFLAIGVPFAVYMLDLSLRNQQSFVTVTGLFDHLAFKAAALLLVWSLSHHILAGLRHLLNDAGVGSTLLNARRSAWWVNIGGIVITLLVVGAIL